MDTSSWRFENGQLIGELVYFSANENSGTFRRVFIATDRDLKQFHEVRYEGGTLNDRNEDPSTAPANRYVVTCTANLY